MWNHEALKAKKWTGQSFDYAQHKLDGWRATFFVQSDGTLSCFGRRLRPDLEFFGRFPSLQDHPFVRQLRKLRLPPMTSIDCEVVTRDHCRSSVVTALKHSADDYDIQAFAIPYYDGEFYGDQCLIEVRDEAASMGLPFVKTFSLLELRHGYGISGPMSDIRDTLLMASEMNNTEGWVLKQGGQYHKWYKLKGEQTVDAIVTGIVEGEGKYDGLIGALVVSVRDNDGHLVEIASVSGFTDKERVEMSRIRDRVRGRVCEVKYQLVGAKNRLVHPRFMRWRPDKPSNECTMSQITEA